MIVERSPERSRTVGGAEEGKKTPIFELHGRALLGNNARTEASQQPRGFQPMGEAQNLVEEVDPETGEISRFEVTKNGLRPFRTPQQARAERYALKSVVNRLFPTSKTAKCCRMRIPHRSVSVCVSPEFHKAHYAGLCRCGSVWLDPVCASKITERRRAELSAAVATAKAMGWKVYLMTCTVPHGLGDDIRVMLDQMLNAWRRMSTGRAGKELRKLVDLRGTIRTLEVTDGQNGFHPHFHALLFIGSTFSPDSVQAGFLPLWQDACVKAGLPCPSDYFGLRVDDGSWAERYVTKWGLEDEMVRGHTKAARGDKGMTPWDMLRDILKNRSQRSEERFRLYADAFKGRRQLYWSNGLKAKLGVEEVSGEELAVIEEESAYVLAELTEDQWRAVLATHSEAALLDVAESNPQSFQDVLAGIVSLYQSIIKSISNRAILSSTKYHIASGNNVDISPIQPTAIKIDQTTKDRMKRLSEARNRSTHWLILEAVRQYVDREEKREDFRQSAIKAWEAYQLTGEHLTLEEADDWLSKLEAGEDVEPPQCHA